jgi:hypothetical protein
VVEFGPDGMLSGGDTTSVTAVVWRTVQSSPEC